MFVSGGGSELIITNRLVIGDLGARNQLMVSNGGAVLAGSNLIVGLDLTSSNNLLTVGNGTVAVTNSSFSGTLDIRRGTNLFNGGLIEADRLLMTNTAGRMVFNGGTLITRIATIDNGAPFVVGANPGSGPATWDVRSNATPSTVANDLRIGNFSPGSGLLITNGGRLSVISRVHLGWQTSNNFALVSGSGSMLSMADLDVGAFGSGNQLVVSNRGVVFNSTGTLGSNGSSSNNVALVTGAGSLWNNSLDLYVGYSGMGNQLVVSNSGMVLSASGHVGLASSNNLALVTGAGSLWNSGTIVVGSYGSGNRLIVSNSGVVVARNLTVGAEVGSANNLLTIGDGTLVVTNVTTDGELDLRGGQLVFNGGSITVDQLLQTTGGSNKVTFNAGTLHSRFTFDTSVTPFVVGNGTSNATFNLVGGGSHSFAAPVVISSNAALTGNGKLTGTVTNFGTLSAGASAGSLRINGDLLLQSSSMMSFELGGLIPTNQYDQVTITSFVDLAGTLSLSLINGFLPDDSDTFTLLKFASTSGSFANVSGGRVSLTNNLASFAVTLNTTNFVIGGVTYTDSDGDGQGDLQEAAAGTDPLVSGSYLRIVSMTRNGSGHYVIVFTSELGKSYRLEWTDNLAGGVWSLILAPVLTNAGPGLSQWIDDGTLTGGLGVGTRVYRIGLQ